MSELILETPSGDWTVRDLNARDVDRIHEGPSRARYKLSAHEDRRVPEKDARCFLRDPAFEVRNAEGVLMAPLSEAALSDTRIARELKPNECIATYDELLKDALLARAAVRPGGQAIQPTDSRETIAAFLSRTPVKVDARPEDNPRAGEGTDDGDPTLGRKSHATVDELLLGSGG